MSMVIRELHLVRILHPTWPPSPGGCFLKLSFASANRDDDEVSPWDHFLIRQIDLCD